MEVPDREQTEYELAAAILLLWTLLDGDKNAFAIAPALFHELFTTHVRPIVVRLYGRARAALADQFGHSYQSQPSQADPSRQTVTLPGLGRTIDQYERELYDRFENRRQSQRQREAEGEEPSPYTEADAMASGVTDTTQLHSRGEIDAARDVEQVNGQRIVAVWRTEPGACPICEPLEGSTMWARVFPNGPPGHPNCRCHLEWRPLI